MFAPERRAGTRDVDSQFNFLWKSCKPDRRSSARCGSPRRPSVRCVGGRRSNCDSTHNPTTGTRKPIVRDRPHQPTS